MVTGFSIWKGFLSLFGAAVSNAEESLRHGLVKSISSPQHVLS
jgi:hypothetical protein